MKNHFLIALLVLMTTTLFGQFAVRAGLNFSNISEVSFETEARTGIHVGFMHTSSIGKNVSFRPGALLSLKGFNTFDDTGELTYLEVPLSFIFHVIGKPSGLYLELGPYGGLMIGSGGITDIEYNTVDLGLNMGAGLTLGRFGVGITYGYGLTSIESGNFSGDNKSLRNRNVGLFGYIAF